MNPRKVNKSASPLSITKSKRLRDIVALAESAARELNDPIASELRIAGEYLDLILGENLNRRTLGLWKRLVTDWHANGFVRDFAWAPLKSVVPHATQGQNSDAGELNVCFHDVLHSAVLAVTLELDPQNVLATSAQKRSAKKRLALAHTTLTTSHNVDAAIKRIENDEPRRVVGKRSDDKQHASVDTRIDGDLPSVETSISDTQNVFRETFSARELSLLSAFNALGVAELLLQLHGHGVDNREVARRTGISQESLSNAAGGDSDLSADEEAKLRNLVIKELLNSAQARQQPNESTTSTIQADNDLDASVSLPNLTRETLSALPETELLARLNHIRENLRTIEQQRDSWLATQGQPMLDALDKLIKHSPEKRAARLKPIREKLRQSAYGFDHIISTEDVATFLNRSAIWIRDLSRAGRLGIPISRFYVHSKLETKWFKKANLPHKGKKEN